MHCFELVIPHPPPPSDGGFPFIPVRPTPQPSHSRRPIAPKNQRFVSIRNRPLYTASHGLFAIRFPLNTPAQNPDAPTRLKLNSTWIEGGGQPPRRPMTVINFPDRKGLIAPKKDPKFIAEKKPKFISKNFRRRTDRYFPNFFQKNLPKNKQLDSTGKQRNSS